MFWGLVLKTNKRYSQQVTKAFHVSQATLDLNTLNESDALVQVWLHTDDTDHLIANVNRQTSHVRLDLAFTEGETVAFYSKGNGTVHLSGYLIPDEDDFGDLPFGDGEEEEEDSDEGVEAPAAAKKRKEKGNMKQIKVGNEEDEEEDEDDDDESDDLDFDGLNQELEDEDLDEEEGSDDEDDDEDDDDEEDEDDDDEEDEEDSDDEVQAPPAKQAKFDKNAKQNGLTNGKAAKKENDPKQKNQQKQQQQQQQKNQKQEKQEQKNQQNQPQKSTPKTLAQGVIIEDLRVGRGPEATPGRKVSVYYEGRLKSNNKVFDSTKAGNGFQFSLGRGEVIRGWDIGVAGMKVGSKRRIICPPAVAYGNKGSPPVIPGNATLIFDVELRGVK
ncbi:46 kDa FK506-binding nuclear protein-like [Sitodiplosis mosellana]|uniref:46 kDa FK506-binding nuclear protein-like n=1 Tax=Sitodiplosis mosellana TaxID=263140 RepID=UPI0024439920|nr:46 kDa FK506-binding nuclear protein-like [Sitodiplosis mosellana]